MMEGVIDEVEIGKHRLSICYDVGGCADPREWDNLGVMVCSHKRYEFPNEADIRFESFGNWNELEKHLREEHDAAVILPIYMYEHSGIGLSTSNTEYPYNCPFDSGMLGVIFMTNKTMKENKFTSTQDAVKVLRGEVEVYGKYVGGEVYCFRLEEKEVCDKCSHTEYDVVDSCGGFYDIKDMAEHVPKEFREWVEKR